MHNREAFLATIAQALGREPRQAPDARPTPVNNYAQTRMTGLSMQDRCDAFIGCASTLLMVNCVVTTQSDAPAAALKLCDKYGGEPVIISGDARLEMAGITQQLCKARRTTVWDPSQGEQNIQLAEQAKVGVVYAEYGLAESGGVVLFSAPERGRSLSLLPESSIFVLRKSTILPRVAQLAQKLHQMAEEGVRMPSCINLIGGPSSTADIELSKVIGVHGPVNAACLIIDDC